MTASADRIAPENEEVRAAVREVCEAAVAPHAAACDESGEFPTASYQALRSRGFHAPRVPARYGGPGADFLSASIIVEEVARACATSALIPAINDLCTTALLNAGTEALCRRILPAVAGGEAMLSFCLSEPEAGSDIAAIATRAEAVGDGYLINGVKRWITHAGVSDFYLVFAVTDPGGGPRGVSAFVVDRTDQGVRFGRLERKLGIRGSPTREIYFDDVMVPAARMLGEPGTGLRLALGALEYSRIGIAAQAVGIAQGALEEAVSYIRRQCRFGGVGPEFQGPEFQGPEFQGVQFMLADMAMKVEAARRLAYTAAAKADSGDADVGFYSAAAKCFASDTAMAVTIDAVQLLGAYGFSVDHPVERMMRDAKITQIYEGTNQIQRIVISRRLLGPRAGTWG